MSETVTSAVMTNDLYSEYDMKFTADISRKMQMPDSLGPVDGVKRMDGFIDASHIFSATTPAFGMTMPDRIYLGESDYSMETSLPPADGFVDDDSIDYDDDHADRHQSYINGTPYKHRENTDLFASGSMVVPPTPGSMLRDGRNGTSELTDWIKIQRHVAKLTCRVERLEEENSRRRQREWLLYPLVLGYCILQLARIFLVRSR